MSNFARKWYTLRHPESSAPDITGLSVETAITVLWKLAPEKAKKKKRQKKSQNKSVAKNNVQQKQK